MIERFLSAVKGGDIQALFDVLAPDVVMLTDGGGVKPAARRPVVGRDAVVGFLRRTGGGAADFTTAATWLNGEPAAQLLLDGEVDTTLSFVIDAGRITRVYVVRNPHKLTGVNEVATLVRE